ncbi:APC family permease [Sneathiella limimaris]|uniref:APC family permease n=1 Tax=Sneathiella limimaris TaxID=1964213 RepID=UPI00146D64EF|nr:amino acid permease [Sneathiella limimaris]
MATDLEEKPTLNRQLSLSLLTLYGLGVTVGAGIYVLVGATASKAGIHAPIAFLLAACVVAFTGFSYSELSTRFPVSAGEAEYVRRGFRSNFLSLIVGLLVVLSGIVSSAAVSIGAVGYLQTFIPLNETTLVTIVISIIGLIAIWGIVESVTLASILTLIELSGLALVIGYGVANKPDLLTDIPNILPEFNVEEWGGILSAGLLAFFAFVGFEDMANVAEEVKNPEKNLPRGIFLTLILSTLIYFCVVTTVVLSVPMDQLVQSSAPLQLVFEGASPLLTSVFVLIAIFATLNGVLVQIIMASRVIYGLSIQGNLPEFLGNINAKTRTPLNATVLVTLIVLALALFFPIVKLAETTSSVVLSVFCLVNLALIFVKLRAELPETKAFIVPIWVPICGLLTSLGLLLSQFLTL